MNIDTLLSHFDGVKKTGYGKYIARCSAHDDRNPSLAISEGDGGRLLLKCWAGCETEDVLSAVGLKFADVMPERVGDDQRYKPLRQRFDARQLLATLDHEAMVTAVIAGDILEHKQIDEDTWDRLAVAVNRINTARAECAPARIGR